MATMEIEKQRWFPQTGACALTPEGFGWSQPLGSTAHPYWEDVMELEDGNFLFDVEYREGGADDISGWVAGAFVKKSCTEFASYTPSFKLFQGTGDDIKFALDHVFEKKGARILDLDIYYDNGQLRFAVILVPNYGSAARGWWWGWGATAQILSEVLSGKAWASFKADGIKKKIVAIEREAKGHFAFVLNELKPGEAWWRGFGADIPNIVSVVNGEAWANFAADNIKKRLVSLKRFAHRNWTFIAVPTEGVGWWWWPNKTWTELGAEAEKNNARIIDIERYGSSDTLFSGILGS